MLGFFTFPSPENVLIPFHLKDVSADVGSGLIVLFFLDLEKCAISFWSPWLLMRKPLSFYCFPLLLFSH